VSEPVKVNRIIEEAAVLFSPDRTYLGEIRSHLELADVRIQIKKHGMSGYFLKWRNSEIQINKNGGINIWLDGFFDTYDKQLNVLLDLKTDS